MPIGKQLEKMSSNSFYIGIIVLIATSCSSQDKNEKHEAEKDDFYKRSAGWDYSRIPLIKPYEVLRLKGKKDWNMNLHTTALQTGVANIKGIDIMNGAIIIHSTEGSILRGSEVPEAWFVIIPEKEIEKGFDKEEEFTAYLISMSIKNVKLHNPDSVYRSFMKKWPIDWRKGDL